MKQILSLVLFATIIALSSCSIEKRVYQSGYYISGRNSVTHEIAVPKRILPILIEENKNSNESVYKSGDTTKLDFKPLKIDSTESNTSEMSLLLKREKEQTNFTQNTQLNYEPISDSIPDEEKMLLAKYEKNHKAKKKIKKIGFYPLIVADLGLVMTLVFLIPWLYGSLENDSVFFTFLFIFLFGLIFLIPLCIAYIILSFITKKQRRKLRKLGVVK
jgi:hypothetical protein